MRIAYLDVTCGIAGDMFLAALVDAGCNLDRLREDLSHLSIAGEFEIRLSRVHRGALVGVRLDVQAILPGGADMSGPGEYGVQHPAHPGHAGAHDHDHASDSASLHLHDHAPTPAGPQDHDHAQPGIQDIQPEGEQASVDKPETEALAHEPHPLPHSPAHPHSHAHIPSHTHDAPHSHGRSYSDIAAMIRSSELPEPVQKSALAVFHRLGEVESQLHGVPMDAIHFHEVGAVDSIVDIVGVCAAIHQMGIEAVYSSVVVDGHGVLECAHGIMPVPAPATLELLRGAPLISCDVPFELVTPTGAALLRHFCKGFGPRPPMVVNAIGYGAGARDIPQRSNLLRVSVGEQLDP